MVDHAGRRGAAPGQRRREGCAEGQRYVTLVCNLDGEMVEHIDNILTDCQNPVANAVSERFNIKIQKIKGLVCDFLNMKHRQNAICFRCGGIDSYPC